MDLEHTVPSEGSQTHKATLCDSIYVKRPQQTLPQRQEVGWSLSGAGWGVTAHRDGVSFWGDENVLELNGSGGCTTL